MLLTKPVYYIAALTWWVGVLIIAPGCNRCQDTDCENGGEVQQERNQCFCECTEGYEGEKCELRATAKFVGTYQVDDQCDSGPYEYESVITEADDPVTRIYINNFGSLGIEVRAQVIEGDSLFIPSQNASGFKVSGSGSMNADMDAFTVAYKYTGNDDSDNCQATYSM